MRAIYAFVGMGMVVGVVLWMLFPRMRPRLRRLGWITGGVMLVLAIGYNYSLRDDTLGPVLQTFLP